MSSSDIIIFMKKKSFLSHKEMRLQTLLKIIEAIKNNATSKRDIQNTTKLSWGTVSEGINFFYKKEIIVTLDKNNKNNKVGRRTLSYDFNPKKYLTMGMEIKPHEIVCSLVNLGNEELHNGKYPFREKLNLNNIFKLIKSAFLHMLKEDSFHIENIIGLTFSLSGALDKGNLIWIKTPRFPEIDNIKFNNLFSLLPSIKYICIEHDINTLAMSIMSKYHWHDNNYLFLHISDGIGMAIVDDDVFFLGSRGFAGEIGHIPYVFHQNKLRCHCGQNNCLETVLSTKGIISYMQKRYNKKSKYFSKILVDLSEEQKKNVFIDYIHPPLLFLCTIAANLFDPQTIILGGKAIEPWLDKLQKSFKEHLRSKTWLSSPNHLKLYKEKESNCAYGSTIQANKNIIKKLLKH